MDEERAAFTLSEEDRYVVEATTKNVSSAKVPRILAIHRERIAVAEARLREVDRERRTLLRTLAMREAAVAALTAKMTT